MKHLQRLAYLWAVRCFGHGHVHDPRVRLLRLIEEVAEACQCQDIPVSKLVDVIDIVYKKKKGIYPQELGGIAMTFAVLCESHSGQIDNILMTELNRVLSLPEDHFTKRNLEKVQP